MHASPAAAASSHIMNSLSQEFMGAVQRVPVACVCCVYAAWARVPLHSGAFGGKIDCLGAGAHSWRHVTSP